MDIKQLLTDPNALNAVTEKFRFKISPAMRAEFYEMMGSLIKDGKPLDAALRELHVRYAAKKRPMASLLGRWSASLSDGKTFAVALKGFASETEGVIMAAAEKSGDLTEGFAQAALVARSGRAIRIALTAELTTPVIQVLVLVFMLVGFSTTVAPQLTQSIPMSAMDDSQRMLFTLARAIADWWLLFVMALAAVSAAALWSMPRYIGVVRPYLDRIPPWSIYKTYCSATFMIAMSALIKSGVPIESAIRFVKVQSSPWLAEHLSLMVGRLRSGMEQGDAMDTGLLTPRMADMVAIYSRTADFDAAVSSIGRLALDDGLANIKATAGMAKTASTLAIGLIVAWMFLSMMGITDAAQRATNQGNQVSTTKGR